MKRLLLLSVFTFFVIFMQLQTFAQDKISNNNRSPSSITINQKIGSWYIQCAYPDNTQNKQLKILQKCIAQRNLTIKNEENRQISIASLTIEKTKDDPSIKKNSLYQLTITIPSGFSLQFPAILNVGKGKQINVPWITCAKNSCIASQVIDSYLQKTLEASKEAQLIIHRVNKTAIAINFDITDIHDVCSAISSFINKKLP